MIERIFPKRVPNCVMRKQDLGAVPTHIMFAALELGVKETLPFKPNPRINEYFQACGGLDLNETFSWCSAFVAFCLRKAYVVGFPKEACNSQYWLKEGTKVDEPQVGDIVVFSDKNKDGFGHTGFFIDETERSVLVLGGNQKNQVCYMWYKKDGKDLSLTEYRRVI